MKVTYTGPFDAVEVPAAGIVAEKGKPVEVPDELGKNLLEQDCWAEPKEKSKERDR